MVRKFFFENEKKIRKALPIIKEKIKIRLFLKGKIVFIKGDEYTEFMVEKILSAIDFGFEIEDALLIMKDYSFNTINIKDYTKRKNLEEIRGRIIGKKGRAIKIIENISGAKIILKRNKVGIIADNEHIEETEESIKSLIKGSKHGNVFSFLERRNTELKKPESDLGLRKPNKKFQ
ncbi:MAG: hypothetical protein QXX68_00305 [Candidatus Pacearchaeota archaeon]